MKLPFKEDITEFKVNEWLMQKILTINSIEKTRLYFFKILRFTTSNGLRLVVGLVGKIGILKEKKKSSLRYEQSISNCKEASLCFQEKIVLCLAALRE